MFHLFLNNSDWLKHLANNLVKLEITYGFFLCGHSRDSDVRYPGYNNPIDEMAQIEDKIWRILEANSDVKILRFSLSSCSSDSSFNFIRNFGILTHFPLLLKQFDLDFSDF